MSTINSAIEPEMEKSISTAVGFHYVVFYAANNGLIGRTEIVLQAMLKNMDQVEAIEKHIIYTLRRRTDQAIGTPSSTVLTNWRFLRRVLAPRPVHEEEEEDMIEECAG